MSKLDQNSNQKLKPYKTDYTLVVQNSNEPEPTLRTRDEWSNPSEFLFSCIALSVGLGNVWRFPFTAYKNGGGAFLIPYMVVLFFIGKPLYFMELAWGQFCSYGQVKAWGVVPLLKGVGYGELIASICGGSYYCAIMGITVYYLVASFQSVLPWTVCPPGNDCNGTESLPEIYFRKEVTNQLENIEDGIGPPDWRLSLCLLSVWSIIFLTVFKGVKSSGKAAYFLALFPYSVLIILLVRGLTLPGSWEGVWYFIKPDWSKILEPSTLYAAISQCFFSLGTGFGATIMNASYNSFSHKIYRDSYIISLLDAFTSLLAGFCVFGTLGNLAQELGINIEDVAKSGPGLAFISYPDAISKMEFVPQVFAVLFFLMLLTLGIGTTTAITNGIVTVICDHFTTWHRTLVASMVCLAGFGLGLIYVTPGGQFLITLVDHFGASFVIYIMVTLEIVGIAWVYGVSKFCTDVEFMLNMKIGWFYRFCWGLIIPVTLVTVLVYSLLTSPTLTHAGVPFPDVALVFGWSLAIVAISIVPICAITSIWRSPGSNLIKKLVHAITPSKDWGPRDWNTRQEWIHYKMK